MVAMAALQVFIVKMFFTGGRKGELSCSTIDKDSVMLTFCRLCVSD